MPKTARTIGQAVALSILFLAAGLSGCSTARDWYIGKASDLTAEACKQPEHYRQAIRTDVWECCGVDTAQACVDPAQRVNPPWYHPAP